MTLPTLLELRPLSLELLLLGWTFAVLLAELFLPTSRKHLLGWATAAALTALLAASFLLPLEGGAVAGTYNGTAWAVFFKRLFLGAAAVGVLGAIEHLRRNVPHRQGEYYLLLLFSVLGMMVLPGATDLILLVVAFELMGIPLYLMAAYGKDDAPGEQPETAKGVLSPAAEAGLKYYLIGAASTTTLLFGAGLVAGMAGTTRLSEIAQVAPSPMLLMGVVMMLGGMAFKIGAAPFHMWVPDTYQGAHAPFVAFLSVAPKAAGVAAICVLFPATLAGTSGTWLPVILALALASMFVGSFFALPQSSLKRLLAFSGVAQVGYVLLGLAAGTHDAQTMVLFYLAAYVGTNIGAFLIVHAVAAQEGSDELHAFEGLSRRSPWLSAAMLLLLLSLAGIPFVVGFWAKLYVFAAALKAGLVWPVVAGALLAIVALFYYLRVVRAMYMGRPASSAPVKLSWGVGLGVGVSVAVAIVAGLWPAPLLALAERATAALF